MTIGAAGQRASNHAMQVPCKTSDTEVQVWHDANLAAIDQTRIILQVCVSTELTLAFYK